MSKRIFLLADLHFGIRNNSLDWLEIHKQYFYDFFIPLLKKEHKKGDILFILGDVFDNRNSINVYIQHEVVNIFKELSKIIPIYVLVGNHDLYFKKTNDINSTIAIQPYVQKVYTKPEIFEFENSKILISPWFDDNSEELEMYKKYNNKADYIFAHTEYSSFKYNSKILLHEGIDFTGTGLNYKRVFSGHIHLRQEKNAITYVGNPFSMTRSDIGNMKGVYIFTPEEDKVEFIENKLSPIFLRKTLYDIMDLTEDEFIKIIKNNFVDIIIPIEYSSYISYQNFNRYNEYCKSLNLEIQDVFNTEVVGIDIDDNNVNFELDSLLLQYIKDLNFDKMREDKILNKINLLKEQIVVE